MVVDVCWSTFEYVMMCFVSGWFQGHWELEIVGKDYVSQEIQEAEVGPDLRL